MQTAILFLACAHFSLSLAAPSLPSFHIHPLSRSTTCPVQLQEDPPLSRTIPARRLPIQPRIVNGDDASANLLPYLVSIVRSGNFVCTGTLISRRWILSAAHCDVTVDDTVVIGLRRPLSATSPDPVSVAISEVFVHESYDPDRRRRYDIVAIQLAEDAPPSARPMQVNVNLSIPRARSFVRVLGYGRTSEGGIGAAIGEPILRQVDVPVTSGSKCEEIYPRVDPELQVCAGYDDGGCDSCQGDSGGPMLQYNDQGEPVLVGVVSSGTGCARPGRPGIYIRSSAFADWLSERPGMVYTKTASTRAVLQPTTSPSSRVVAIAAGAGGAVAVVILLITCFVIRRRRQRSRKLSRKESTEVVDVVPAQEMESEPSSTLSSLPTPPAPIASSRRLNSAQAVSSLVAETGEMRHETPIATAGPYIPYTAQIDCGPNGAQGSIPGNTGVPKWSTP